MLSLEDRLATGNARTRQQSGNLGILPGVREQVYDVCVTTTVGLEQRAALPAGIDCGRPVGDTDQNSTLWFGVLSIALSDKLLEKWFVDIRYSPSAIWDN